jgi:hypothetical protein
MLNVANKLIVLRVVMLSAVILNVVTLGVVALYNVLHLVVLAQRKFR